MRKGGCMETVKTDNDRMMETSPHEAGFFTEESEGRFSRSGYIRVRDTQTRWMKKFPG